MGNLSAGATYPGMWPVFLSAILFRLSEVETTLATDEAADCTVEEGAWA